MSTSTVNVQPAVAAAARVACGALSREWHQKLFVPSMIQGYIASAGLPFPSLVYAITVVIEIGAGALLLSASGRAWWPESLRRSPSRPRSSSIAPSETRTSSFTSRRTWPSRAGCLTSPPSAPARSVWTATRWKVAAPRRSGSSRASLRRGGHLKEPRLDRIRSVPQAVHDPCKQ